MLRKLGVEAALAPNGQEAVEAFSRERFELVLMNRSDGACVAFGPGRVSGGGHAGVYDQADAARAVANGAAGAQADFRAALIAPR